MPNREKVIKGLACCCHTDDYNCTECPYTADSDCTAVMSMDVLDLLREQKAYLEDLERKYTALLNEKISELIEENAKLNAEMNQAISDRM